jgi:hypothetical protein
LDDYIFILRRTTTTERREKKRIYHDDITEREKKKRITRTEQINALDSLKEDVSHQYKVANNDIEEKETDL